MRMTAAQKRWQKDRQKYGLPSQHSDLLRHELEVARAERLALRLPAPPKTCEGCKRITAMMVQVDVGMLPCGECGRVVYYPEDGQVWGRDNCRYPR